jgi:hypothetical protein
MSTYYEDGLTVSLRTSADGTNAVLGVIIEGAFIPFHWQQIGGFKDDLATVEQDAHQYLPGPATDATPPAPETPAA